MKPLRSSLFGWVAMALCVLASILSVRGLQLCFEADGHVRLEFAAAECRECCPEDGSLPSGVLDSCGCVDLVLEDGDSLVRKSQLQEQLPLPPMSIASTWVVLEPPARLPLEPAYAPGGLQLGLLSCVVLRL